MIVVDFDAPDRAARHGALRRGPARGASARLAGPRELLGSGISP